MATSHIPFQVDKDGLSDDFKKLLSTLPTDESFFGLDAYQYQGFWCVPKYLQAAIAIQQHFQASEAETLLVTLPKSGTTWLKALTYATVNRGRYPYNEHPLLNTNPHDLVPFLDGVYTKNPKPDLTSFPSPRLFATHLPYTSLPKSVVASDLRIVYLCRNPRDNFISSWKFMNKLTPKPLPLEDAFDLYCRGVSGYGPFWDHILGYWKESLQRPQKILFLKYEELKREPAVHLKRLGELLGYPFSPKEESEGVVEEILKLCSFENLSSLEVNKTGISPSALFENKLFFRRGEVGDSMNYLTPDMTERLDRITEQRLHGYGLTL